MADMFSPRYRLCKGTKSISTVSKDIGELLKPPVFSVVSC